MIWGLVATVSPKGPSGGPSQRYQRDPVPFRASRTKNRYRRRMKMAMSESRLSEITRWIRMLGVMVMFLVALASAPRTANAFECEDYTITCSTLNACISVMGNSCGCEGIVNCREDHPECAGGPQHKDIL
jgi:hypothetical protein